MKTKSEKLIETHEGSGAIEGGTSGKELLKLSVGFTLFLGLLTFPVLVAGIIVTGR